MPALKEIALEDLSPLYLTKGYKYKLERIFVAKLPIRLEKDIVSNCGLVSLSKEGLLTVEPGFPWDGASGLTIDTPSSMRGAFIHDVLYLLMRQGHLPYFHKTLADEVLRDVCILDKMWKWRAKKWFKAVQTFGRDSATKLRKVFVYPKEVRDVKS